MPIKIVTTVVFSALVLTACGGTQASSTATGAGTGTGTGTVVRVGVIPTIEFAPLYVAQDLGYFKEVGITVETETLQNAAAVVPAVLNGQLQVGTTASVPFLNATAKGLPLLAIANGADSSSNPAQDYSGLFTTQKASITRPRDLEGKTVAVNALQSLIHLATSESVKKDGGDPAKVRYVAMPFPNMASALQQGTVDAASVVEPFYQSVAATGARLVDNLYKSAFPANTTLAFFFSSQKFVQSDPAVAKKFVEAVNKAATYAASHPDQVRASVRTHVKLDAAVAEKIRLPQYGAPVSAASLGDTAGMMVALGFIPQAPASGTLVWMP